MHRFVIKFCVITFILVLLYKIVQQFFKYIKKLLYPSCLRPLSTNIFLPSIQDEQLEEGKDILQFENHSMVFIGVDNIGNKIIIKITRRPNFISEAHVTLHLANGSLYKRTCETSKITGKWSAGCLLFEIIEPMKNWRISFNGSLRSDHNTEHHVKINLIWRAFCRPYIFHTKNDEHDKDIKLDSVEDGFEQWGSIIGTITVDSNFSTNIHLMSLRQSYWGCKKWSNIIGFSENGTMFSIGSSRHKNKSSGHVRFPRGCTSYITSDFPKLTSLPDNLKFIISGKINCGVNIECEHKTSSCSKNLCMMNFQGFLDENSVDGFVQIWDSHVSKDATVNKIERKSEEKSDTQILLLQLESPLCTNVNIVGGKAASLSILTSLEKSMKNKLNTVVPQGFCLTKMAMELQIKSSRELKSAIRSLVQDAHSLDLTETCKRIEQVWISTKVCSELQYAVSKQIDKYTPYAVRSSGLSEDTATMSSAGQNGTYLGCIGLDSILQAVQKCWASLYSFQSVQYRRLHGIPLKSSMGIVIQKMVAAEISGVMFTCDPVSGNPFQSVITANYGLGETVVSGAVEPDTIHMLKDNSKGEVEFTILNQDCGKKTHQISMTDNGLIVKMNLDDCSANVVCISPEETKLLAKIGLFLEEEFGSPCDIEWAILKGIVYLLQCRPVTTLHAWTNYELLHEYDSALLPMEPTSKANTGEVLPGATSILSQSLSVKACDVAVTLQKDGDMNNNDFYNYTNTIISHQQTFLNVCNTLLMRLDKERTTAQTAAELALCGHIIIDDSIHQQALLRNGVNSSLMKLQLILKSFNLIWWSKQIVKEAEDDALKFSIAYKDCLSSMKLFELISQHLLQLEQVSKRHISVSTVNVFWQIILLTILLEGEKDLTNEHFEDIAALLQSCSSVISAEIPTGLEEIAKKISDCENKDEFYNMPPNLAKQWLKVHCPRASHLLSKFLICHGHRSIREVDFYTETWGLNSTPLLANLQNIVRGGLTKTEKSVSEHNYDNIIDKLKTPKKSSTRRALRFIFPFCQSSSGQREVTKNSLLLVTHTFRIAFNQLGNLMARENYIPLPKLIFFCSYYEIKKLLLTRDSTILHKALRRQRLWEQWDKLKFPELMKQLPEPITSDHLMEDDNVCVKGTLVYPGRAEGRACVIFDLNESVTVKAGDILITGSTDVGWSPLFPLLSGIVTELGGLISHGAVVAREYGVPCLVGATSATTVFKTGDQVVLDGARSIIYKVSK